MRTLTAPSTNWNLFTSPVAKTEMLKGPANEEASWYSSRILRNETVWSGTMFSHNFKTKGALLKFRI